MATMDQKLSPEQNELVAVGASVGAGCHPCVDHHLKAGAKAGLDDERLLATVTSAERATAEAAVRMDDHVRGKLGPTVTEPALLSHLEEALASLGAALGANDATNIELQLRTALDLGASKAQLEQAIATAKTVQENAARIHLREAERLLSALAPSVAAPGDEADPGDSCGCDANDENTAAAAGEAVNESAPGCSDSMAELFATADSGEMAGIATAMANCQRIFEHGCRQPVAPVETNDPATEAAGLCAKEA